MIPLPLTAVHDNLKPGDEPCTVLVTLTPSTLVGSCGGEGGCVGVLGFGVVDAVCVVDVVTVVSLVGDILFGSAMNTTEYNS